MSVISRPQPNPRFYRLTSTRSSFSLSSKMFELWDFICRVVVQVLHQWVCRSDLQTHWCQTDTDDRRTKKICHENYLDCLAWAKLGKAEPILVSPAWVFLFLLLIGDSFHAQCAASSQYQSVKVEEWMRGGGACSLTTSWRINMTCGFFSRIVE